MEPTVVKYKAYATRTKTDGRRVLVAESSAPIDRSELKAMLTARSLEFDDTTVVDFEIREDVISHMLDNALGL